MALYVITDGDGDDNSIVVDGIENLKKRLIDLHDDGIYDTPQVYKLEKKMTVTIKTVVELKGE